MSLVLGVVASDDEVNPGHAPGAVPERCTEILTPVLGVVASDDEVNPGHAPGAVPGEYERVEYGRFSNLKRIPNKVPYLSDLMLLGEVNQ